MTVRTEQSELFHVPEFRRKFGIFPSPRAYIEETVERVTPCTSLRSVLCQQVIFEEGGSFEFFQVPGSMGLTNTSICVGGIDKSRCILRTRKAEL